MGDLTFACLDAVAERHAAVPTLALRLRITETTGTRIGAIVLRCQIRIQPQQRRYSAAEGEQLHDLFGEPERWADTQNPMQLATVAVMVPAFTGSIDVEVPVPCSYDLEVAAGRYFAALDDGEVPLLMLFSGTVFTQGAAGLVIEQVPWHKECAYRLPVRVWREIMDLYFPNAGWLRLRRDTLDALGRYKSRSALATWDDTVAALLATVGHPHSAPRERV